ncbi:MAG: nitroreductase [Rhodoferax sp.]|jgi:nitroreductase|uniref:nitroreductase family protein n=1 Tax=Rhodoferax sp. TaxID=50421 RepID=UPI0008C95F2D|nr:nitroreductase [Rhodoferax sp.]MDP2679985.1 nitroreductase [Rhodoferax sp.]OGB60213.1 MAG: nitroreductase [Burkholderiales bacterium RIFOXYD12_FULL_59_19]OGB81133.1 MAG: nitroreductase [Burkholderiales bacterium RIFOXYC12_FULL_60_6]
MTDLTRSTDNDLAAFALTLITSRQNILPKRLAAPGPSDAQVNDMFLAAASAPDHGMVMPWRFVLVPSSRRAVLADAFGLALAERDASATPEQIEQAREKAFRAPFLALAIARLGPCEPDIAPLERMVSVGAAIQNFLLCAHSMGFGSSLTSGQAMHSAALRQLFALTEGEQAVCCINVGTVIKRKPARLRPDVAAFVSSL